MDIRPRPEPFNRLIRVVRAAWPNQPYGTDIVISKFDDDRVRAWSILPIWAAATMRFPTALW